MHQSETLGQKWHEIKRRVFLFKVSSCTSRCDHSRTVSPILTSCSSVSWLRLKRRRAPISSLAQLTRSDESQVGLKTRRLTPASEQRVPEQAGCVSDGCWRHRRLTGMCPGSPTTTLTDLDTLRSKRSWLVFDRHGRLLQGCCYC